ncbi:MAG: sn-glycerol-3-phosphate ABC transporter ATP-binding protein UgpC, partial [Krumholzibacteria bacterium]|nr:sn-glycerol-3-phosphate ABC transporter ATP-binding protein UgpC [Candidatus Krumholzibacteria bacterium]
MAQVVLAGVRKCYGEVEVIPGLDLEVRRGEFMVLVGPSGCGKSTALRMIAGLEEITAGEISIDGKVVNDLPPKERDIAMVFQNYALYPHMTVRQNLDFGLRIRKLPRAEIDRRVGEAARILGLEAYLERKPRQLSGGQRQRVAVGRAIVRQPAVFLFDEPLSNLDAKLRVQMRAEITGLQRRLGTTTVYVTHDQVEAMTMGHRIAVLKDGELQQVGTPRELYETPANLFVARFIGTLPLNVLSGTIGRDGRSVSLAGLDLDLELGGSAGAAARGHGGRAVLVGVRAEHLRDVPRTGGGPTAAVQLQVELVEPLGHEVLVHGRLAGGGT